MFFIWIFLENIVLFSVFLLTKLQANFLDIVFDSSFGIGILADRVNFITSAPCKIFGNWQMKLKKVVTRKVLLTVQISSCCCIWFIPRFWPYLFCCGLHKFCFRYLNGILDPNIYCDLQGHRAELYAARVAKCLAALEGREKVSVEDLKKAVKYSSERFLHDLFCI